MEELKKILKHEFKDESLLKKALTHSSCQFACMTETMNVWSFWATGCWGFPSPRFYIVCFRGSRKAACRKGLPGWCAKRRVAMVGRTLRLNEFMDVANREIRDNENVLCDVCEAVIGAIYIDGGVEDAIKFVNNHWRELIDKNVAPPKDAKTQLQEVAHVKGYGAPVYKMVGRTGSEHEPTFFISVSLKGVEDAVGEGRNKKLAEFDAAAKMLQRIE